MVFFADIDPSLFNLFLITVFIGTMTGGKTVSRVFLVTFVF
jgi:hypothetical protein